jgi:pyridoxamine 5'-phosphate oxidase-like protein
MKLDSKGARISLDLCHEEAHNPPKQERTMPIKVKQGDLGLLQHPSSKELLESQIPARMAYVWTDGTPRVIPIWFHWNGREIILATPPKAPKLKALAKNPKVSLTIDDNVFPHKVLLIRGSARLQTVDGIVPEYATAAERYFGREQGQAWVENLRTLISSMVRITVTPEWVGLLDFQTRFPSALSA